MDVLEEAWRREWEYERTGWPGKTPSATP